jgi:hypothetical protein
VSIIAGIVTGLIANMLIRGRRQQRLNFTSVTASSARCSAT